MIYSPNAGVATKNDPIIAINLPPATECIAKLDGELIKQQFGKESPCFAKISGQLSEYLHDQRVAVQSAWEDWERAFSALQFQKELDLVISELRFVQETYLVLFAKCLLASKFVPDTCLQGAQPFLCLEQYFLDRGVTVAAPPWFAWGESIPNAWGRFMQELRGVTFEAGDLFSALYQDLVTPADRHALGEFYTPPELVREMVHEAYSGGMLAFDPACGSGTFLVEIIAQIRASRTTLESQIAAIANVYGADVNSLAVFISNANVFLNIADMPVQVLPMHIFQCDFLFPDLIFPGAESLNPIAALMDPPVVDLLIGNPPWLVLNGITSKDYKRRVKDLARDLGIMMGGKLVTHTEISALFFYQGAKHFLKDSGRIFFVATASLLSGDQHAKFRQFTVFSQVMAWVFDQDVFRIHNICLSMHKGNLPFSDRLRVTVIPIHATHIKGQLQFQKGDPVVYVPCNFLTIVSEAALVKRLIPEDEVPSILPQGGSPYFCQFYQGASLVPRSFLFINMQNPDDEIATILPDTTLAQKCPWDFSPYRNGRVEREYIFRVAKSLDLVPFTLLKTNLVFLPVTQDLLMYDPHLLKPLARQHFAHLSNLYVRFQKQGASITTLWDRINYNKGLSNPRQSCLLKVIFPGSGSIVKAAILRGNVIVDTSCYYFGTENEEEAYYLTGILNAPCISTDLKRRGATGAGGGLRHLHKKPLEYPIPLFDASDPLHIAIQNLATQCERTTGQVIHQIVAEQQSNSPLHPRSIQNRILYVLRPLLQELDGMVLKLVSSPKEDRSEYGC